MTNKEILQAHIAMVDFIADISGPNYEVVLHDVSKPEASVIAIRNGHITGREIGSPLTDLALKVLKQKDYLGTDFITNYDGYSDQGKKFLSSTYFIKNDSGELVGMICVNNDISCISDLNESYKLLMERFNYVEKEPNNSPYKESFDTSLVDVANSIISKTINNLNVPPNRMTIDEKVRIVHELNEEGVFLLKGAVSEVAEQLNISETTVYRYLNKDS